MEFLTLAGVINLCTLVLVGLVVVSRDISVPDVALSVSALVFKAKPPRFTPPTLSENILYIAIIVFVAAACLSGLMLYERARRPHEIELAKLQRRRTK